MLARAVGHLDDQAARGLDEQRERVVAGDGMDVDGQPQGVQPGVQGRLPDGPVPLDPGGPPDVVHQDVQGALLASDTGHQLADLGGHQMIDLDGDSSPRAAGRACDEGRLP